MATTVVRRQTNLGLALVATLMVRPPWCAAEGSARQRRMPEAAAHVAGGPWRREAPRLIPERSTRQYERTTHARHR